MKILFSNWKSWTDRAQLPSEPGIYVISNGSTDNIIYIGKTWSQKGLRGRIRQFNRCTIKGEGKHSGGRTFHKHFGANVDDLFVSVHVVPVDYRNPETLSAYVLYVERRLIWEHVEKHGMIPACNSQ